MVWKTPAVLLLLLLSAAAAPPDDCSSGTPNSQALPTGLDLAGRPSLTAGLSGQTFTAPASADGCRSALPSAAQSTTLRSESGDILHGLPAPDLLQRMDEPRRAPAFQ